MHSNRRPADTVPSSAPSSVSSSGRSPVPAEAPGPRRLDRRPFVIVATGIALAVAATAFGALAHAAPGPAPGPALGPVAGTGPGAGPGTSASTRAGTAHGAPTQAATDAIDAAQRLAAGSPGTEYFSPALVDALGYTPEISGAPDELALRSDGDCSSPVPLPSSFETPCKSHDLGYDLLRVADAGGAPIPGDLRLALDRQLGARMAETCAPAHSPLGSVDHAGCRAAAGVAEFAVEANTLRQHRGAPVDERFPW